MAEFIGLRGRGPRLVLELFELAIEFRSRLRERIEAAKEKALAATDFRLNQTPGTNEASAAPGKLTLKTATGLTRV